MKILVDLNLVMVPEAHGHTQTGRAQGQVSGIPRQGESSVFHMRERPQLLGGMGKKGVFSFVFKCHQSNSKATFKKRKDLSRA